MAKHQVIIEVTYHDEVTEDTSRVLAEIVADWAGVYRVRAMRNYAKGGWEAIHYGKASSRRTTRSQS